MKILSISAILISASCLFGQGEFAGKLRPFGININLGQGFGADYAYTGIVTNFGDKVLIYTSGGMRIELAANYTYRNHFQGGISVLAQNTSIVPFISNGSGSFTRNYATIGGKYILFLGKRKAQHLNFGAFLPYLFRGQMTFDFSKIPDRDLEEFNYKKNVGAGILAEYEVETKKRHWAWGAGIEYLYHHFKIDNIKINNEPVPLAYWGDDVYVYDFQSHSFNVYLRLNYRFGKIK